MLRQEGWRVNHKRVERLWRQECLNAHWFLSIPDAREKIDAWKEDYNTNRPHSSLGNMTPREFTEQCTSLGLKATLQPTKFMVTA